MTSREPTSLLPLPISKDVDTHSSMFSDRLYRLAFGAISWPWLLYSLWGGTRASKEHLLERIGLDTDALPHLGSWKADTGFLHRIVDAVEDLQPRTVVELGAGASTLVCATALQKNGGGRLVSFDQHAGFVAATASWLKEEGADADLRHAPLLLGASNWPGAWYDLIDIPETIDLLIIDGPPWVVHPFVRGAADSLFDRLSPGGIVLLDDAARPGERVVAKRWRRRWPNMTFKRIPGSTKGTLVGRKAGDGAKILAFPDRRTLGAPVVSWQRTAAILALITAGWLANDLSGTLLPPAHAASFVDEASSFSEASLRRNHLRPRNQIELFDPAEVSSATGLSLPDLPNHWRLIDVQIHPSEREIAATLALETDRGELVSLFAKRAETPAENFPLLALRERRSIAYWESGPYAYALTGELEPERMLALAADVAAARNRPLP